MDQSSLDPRLVEQLVKLQQKYDVMGQDLSSYLDGLLHADYLTYWDYIHLDTLLSLQTPNPPSAHVRERFVIEINGVLRREQHAETESARLFE